LFIVISYFRNGKFINEKWTYSLSDYKNKFRAKYPDNIQDGSSLTHVGRIANRFLITGTVIKDKSSSEWPPISGEIVEETPQICVACLF
jgi:RPA family protein